jgi:hypothetical protein
MCFRGINMAEILMFNIEKSKAIKIKMLCRKFFMEATEVSKEDFGCKISYLLGITDDREGAENSVFTEEMLYFADVNGGLFSIFLDRLRRQRLSVALKAVKTETNVHFTAYELFKEISAEREAIARGESAH